MRSEYTHSNCTNCKVYHQSIFCTMTKGRPFARKKVKFAKGDNLYRENDESKGVFCLKSGQVEIQKYDAEKINRNIGIARPGELIGASSIMVNPKKYSTSAVAFRPTEACFISKSDMLTILGNNPKIAMNLMRKLADKLFDLEPYM